MRALLNDSVDSNPAARTSRMDSLLIASTSRMAKDSESATDKKMDSLTNEHTLLGRP